MNEYLRFKRKIERRVEILEKLIGELEHHRAMDKKHIARWQDQLRLVEASLQDSVVRVAVVGSVKSGKSTLINALLGKDLLKRGAGITTSFITRIHTDGEIGGWVELKPWSQVQEELNATIRSLPIPPDDSSERESSDDTGTQDFDLRRSEDRERLRELLRRVQNEWQQIKGRLHPDFLLLNGYLEGYKGLSPHMGDTVNRVLFDARTLDQHQRYVEKESQAVFVRDLEIHYPVDWLGKRVEIADCQGSDSPNPLHLAHIQRYLLRSHFLLYVVHSRTGLREADFKLLDFIKTLRMFSQTFFVLNVDLDAHPDAEDIERLKERVREEIAWVVPNPRLFSFSGLCHLTDQLGESAPAHDRRRSELWSADPSVVDESRAEFARFQDELVERISIQRSRVLMGTGLSRLGVVVIGILDSARAQQRFLDRDLSSLKQSTSILKNKHKAFQDTLNTLRHAIFGLRDSLKHEMNATVDAFLDLQTGPIVQETLDVIEHYSFVPPYECDFADPRQVFRILHRFYLDFRHSLARFLVERLNLELLGFARQQEEFLEERLRKSSAAFWSLFSGALDDYRQEMAAFQIPLHAGLRAEPLTVTLTDDRSIPTFDAFLDHQAVSRGLLLLKFGLGRFTRLLTELKTRIGRTEDLVYRRTQGNHTLEEAIGLVKSEAKAEVLEAFSAYQGAFKTDHMLRLVDRAIKDLLEAFTTRAEMARFDFASLVQHGEMEGEHREVLAAVLDETVRVTGSMIEELDELRSAVNLEGQPRRERASLEGAAR